jgi:hypothetical protein
MPVAHEKRLEEPGAIDIVVSNENCWASHSRLRSVCIKRSGTSAIFR